MAENEQIVVDENKNEILSQEAFRAKIVQLQEELCKRPNVLDTDAAIEAVCPLKHSFAKGLYVREITVPAGTLVVTKIHRFSHPAFLLKGDCSILEESGVRRIQAPCTFITAAGTKRVVYCHTDTIWTTVHATEETDLDKIEDEIIAKTFADLKELT
jgi:hypothetical protein